LQFCLRQVPRSLVPSGGYWWPRATAQIAVNVHHAADVDLEGYRDDEVPDSATVVLHLRHLVAMEPPTRTVVYEGALDLPDGRLALGDADSEIVLAGLAKRMRIRVEADEAVASGLTEAWVQLAAAD
jgi:hypothetical protein